MLNSDEQYLHEAFQKNSGVQLPGINELFVLPRGILFRYEGEVDSFPRALAEVDLRIREGIGETRWLFERFYRSLQVYVGTQKVAGRLPGLDQSLGCCYRFEVAPRTSAYFLAKKRGMEPTMGDFIDGHESGEFLQGIHRQDFLQRALEKEGVDIDATRCAGEDFADLSGLLSLKKRRLQYPDVRLPLFRTPRPFVEGVASRFGF